jgi:bifunctional non-homologous end joining protein LigD
MTRVTIDGTELTITHPDKPLWPDAGITKLDYIHALAALSPYLLPHTSGKALTAIRYPHGVGTEFFYQKRPPKGTPEWVDTVIVRGDEFICLNSVRTLVWLGNLAAMEFHTPFGDLADETVCALVFDLDPSEGQTFDAAAACALNVHETLSSLGIACHVKTSGATGLQVYVPTKRMAFDKARDLNKFFGQYFAAKHPDSVTIERLVKNRGGKLYFDYLQMSPGKSIVSVYSPRAVACGAVSMPITWDELRRGVKPCDFTLQNAPDRLARVGDLFEPMLREGGDLSALDEILAHTAR